ncbi:GNAT family N-acetyltransferase [Liquorilactobacillus mali]|uniref:GNAT family N-acetyltransferase n=1 Tax=Liquorilactobacillus mali TaxID=1618 RepID=UPI002955209D|nr:GNAT family N-acetyltransferase [Liquorilactobacillus mali]MDV7758861.1 GNAT family N-acetyltransferase [Liquorilactobacillus mali]
MIKIIPFEKLDSKNLLEYLKKVSLQTNNLGIESQEVSAFFNVEKIERFNKNSEASVSFVAKNDETGQIIGLAQITRKLRIRYKNQAEFAISVDKEYWGQHFGSKLIEACINQAASKWRIDGLYLEVLSDNQRAIGLYQKYGFKVVGDLPILLTISGQNKPGKIMFKDLKK